MNNYSKVLVNVSLVISTTFFSVGCGDNTSCCNGNDIKATINLLGNNHLEHGDTLPLNVHTLNANGTTSSSDGSIIKAVWTAYENCTKDTIIDGPKTVASKDTAIELDIGNPGVHKVCVVITDNNGNSDEDCKCITVQELNGPSASISGLPQNLKVGCPLPTPTAVNSITNSGSNTLTYAWTFDGDNAGTAVTPTLPTTLTATPNPHEVCLTVTDSNGLNNQQCQNITIMPHTNPTAVMKVWNSGDINQSDISAGNILTKGNRYNLSCAGSRDDCPDDDENITCTWNASSYKAINGNCDIDLSQRVYYIQNCFDDAEHAGHGAQQTTPDTSAALVSYIILCTSAADFDCIEVTMTASDKLHGDLNSSIKKIYSAN